MMKHDDMYFNDCVKFCRKLFEKTGKQQEQKSIIVFCTRKAYCLYKYLRTEGLLDDPPENVEVWSDRYVTKLIEPRKEQYTVYLIDDTVSTGRGFEEALRQLELKLPQSEVKICVIYADERKKFKGALSIGQDISIERIGVYPRYCPSAQLLGLSRKEIQWFQEAQMPFVVDLPWLKQRGADSYKFRINKEKWVSFVDRQERWKYVDSGISLSSRGKRFDNSFFILTNSLLKEFSPLVQSLTVRMLLKEEREDIVVSFTPFAILRSASQEDLMEYFRILYEETKYYEDVKKYLENGEVSEEKKSILYKGVYRTVVYGMSYYVGQEFIRDLDLYGVLQDVVVDDSFDKENNPPELMEAYEETWNHFSPRLYLNKMVQEMQMSEQHRGDAEIGISPEELGMADSGLTRKSAFHLVENYVYIKKPSCVAIEELESTLYQAAGRRGANAKLMERLLARVIIEMLNMSFVANKVEIEGRKVRRGFCAGENSDLILDIGGEIFFTGVYFLYQHYTKECGTDLYDTFVDKFRSYLRNMGYWNSLIDNETFQFCRAKYRQLFTDGAYDVERRIEDKSDFIAKSKERYAYTTDIEQFARDVALK